MNLWDYFKKIKRTFEKSLKTSNTWTYLNTLDELIEDYEFDYKKFLKIAFLKAIKNDAELKTVYE